MKDIENKVEEFDEFAKETKMIKMTRKTPQGMGYAKQGLPELEGKSRLLSSPMMVKNDIMESINQLKNENQEKQRAKTKLDEMMDEYEKSPYKVEQPTK